MAGDPSLDFGMSEDKPKWNCPQCSKNGDKKKLSEGIKRLSIEDKRKLIEEYIAQQTAIEDHIAQETAQNKRSSIFQGASRDAETVTYENGASESKTDLRFDLLPAVEIAKIAQTLGKGAVKYGDTNWKGISTASHLNHALQHVFAYLAGDKSDDHLSHAATRCLFAMYTENNKSC